MMHWSIFVILLHVPVLLGQDLYPSPEHGALVCLLHRGNNRICTVLCKEGTDFLFNPPLVYYNSAGQWNFWALPGQPYETRLPWPNCSANANQSWLKSQGLASHFFDGDCNDPNVQERLKDKGWTFFRGNYVPPPFCLINPDCHKDSLRVYCGAIPVDGSYTNWGAWETCSTSCGGGNKVRRRSCTNPPPSNGGLDCRGLGPDQQTENCNSQSCPGQTKLYPAPEYGALACLPYRGNDRFCTVLCKEGTDFLFNPPLMYYSSAGQWNFWALPGQPYETRLPWPNCSAHPNPSWLKSVGFASHFFDGDCNDLNVQERLKDNAWAFFRGNYVPPPFCLINPDCRKDNLQVYCGCVIKPLGMESGVIPDSSISAFSEWDGNHGARNARLNFKPTGGRTGAWSAKNNDQNQWLKVDFGHPVQVSQIQIQGREDCCNQFVKSYAVSYSQDNSNYQTYMENGQEKVFKGNSDPNSVVTEPVSPAISARYIRIHPRSWNNHISLRVEFLGC